MTQLEACSDAVIAIAITLLVLDVKVPAVDFYDDPSLITPAADALAAFVR